MEENSSVQDLPVEAKAWSESSLQRWYAARRRLEQVIPDIEMDMAQVLEREGLTAVEPGWVFLHENLHDFELRWGKPPPSDQLPEYLRGIDLAVWRFRLPGTVVRTPSKFWASGAPKYIRVKHARKWSMDEWARILAQFARERSGKE